MVGMMSSNSCSPETLLALVTSAISATTIPSKLDSLRQLSEIVHQENDAAALSQLLPLLFDLQSDQHSPVRKFATEIVGDIGVKHVEFVPEIVYLLINVLEDRVPAVARQAITCGLNIFRSTLEKIAIQGLCTSELDDELKASWESVLALKESIYAIAFQSGSGGVRLLALKFVEAVILLYTPDPNGSPEPPSHEGTGVEFNVSWIRGGHPVLNIGDLSIEASKRLALLLDQLRFPTVKSVSNLVIIVVINSLATVVKKRPPFYGRILPVLLGLDPSNSGIEGMHGYGACHALKKAFLTCLKCTHQGAAPWRDRLVGALREMKVEGLEEEAMLQIFKSNGGAEESNEDLQGAKEEKLVIKPSDDLTGKLKKKRVVSEENSEVAEDNNNSGKRAKTTPSVSEESNKELNRNITVGTDEITSDATTSNRIDEDNGPVQQLVAMFGALVAQGERAVGSLEILISSISADLLADVVMANMRYLPSSHPEAKGDDELLVNMPIVGSHSQAKYPPSFLANVLSLSTTFPPVALQLNAHRSVTNDVVAPQVEEEALHNTIVSDSVGEYAGISHKEEDEMMPAGLPTSPIAILPGMEVDGLAIPSEVHDISNPESGIPGLDSSARIDGFSETLGTSSVVSTDVEDASQEVVTSLAERSNLELLPSVSTDRSERSEELSSKATVTDTTSMISSTATSLGLSCPVVLPKMSAPVVILADEQKDQLQTTAFIRVIEAYKQIAVAGGSQVRFSLLASLGLEFPSDLDPWKLLQNHVLDDYVNHEGHELTLRVLYRLFSEVEEERDLFSSTTAASAYESFLLIVAKTLRDSFPPSDKSLSRLLGEAPSLPKSVLNLLEALCCPESCDKSEKDSQSGDRVTQGLSTVWSLILLRPPIREDCLKIALQSAVHHLEEVRMKAIRLVANRLYPLSSISQQIEGFATQKMLSIVKGDATVSMDTEESITEPKDSNLQKPEKLPVSVTSKDLPSDTHPSSTLLSTPENQQYMSLYFALCTKKHSLFREIFVVYKSASKDVKQAVRHQIPILVRTMGSSSELLQIISDPPNGSEELLIQILQTLTDGTVPSPELLFTIRKLYDSKLKNAEILIPILPFLPREEVLLTFPHLVNLPMDKFQAALARVLQGSSHSGPVLTPAEVLIAIHGIDPDRDGIPLKKVTDACNACFEQRQTFTQQVLAKVLNQLVEQIPLPLLFMRTVLQAIGAFPALVEFIMDILSRLVSKQIWKYPKLWVGFLKCALLTQPKSFSVLLQLPPLQLENALNRTAALKAPLVAHASQPNIKSSLPRSTLVVLGVITEPQPSSQSQTSQVQTVDASISEKEVITEKYASNSEKEVITEKYASNSEKEEITEKSKDSSDAS